MPSSRVPGLAAAAGSGFMVLTLAVAGGCLFPSAPDIPQLGRVSLYLVATPNDSRNPADLLHLIAANGQSAVVLSRPMLTSADFLTVKSIPGPEGDCLKFSLAPPARYQWMQLSRDLVGRTLAVSVDGWLQFQLPLPAPAPAESEPYLTLCGDWNPAILAAIVQQAADNYQQLKPHMP